MVTLALSPRLFPCCVLACLLALLPLPWTEVHAQQASASGASTSPGGPPWAGLTVAQQMALSPLKGQWETTDANRKAKWLVVAERFPRMSAEEQQRLQGRMAEWARMSPQQRGQVRLQFQDARDLHPAERKERWAQYQALPVEQRQALANRNLQAVQNRPAAVASSGSAALAGQVKPAVPRPTQSPSQVQRTQRTSPSALASSLKPTPKVVSPMDVRAGPGATTTLLSPSAAVPLRQPVAPASGRQGVLALPPHVDRRTLLPVSPAQGTQRLTQSQRPASASGTAKQ